MVSLIYSDCIDNPIDGVEFSAEHPEYKSYIPFEKLEEAREMVAAELPTTIKELDITDDDFLSAKSEICQLDIAIPEHQQILRLQIPIHNPPPPEVLQPQHHTAQNKPNRTLAQLPKPAPPRLPRFQHTINIPTTGTLHH